MAIMACCCCYSSALFSSSTVICPKPFSSSSFSPIHPPSVAFSSYLRRRKSALIVAAPLILSSRHRHRASAGRPPPESTGSSSNSTDDDEEEKSSISSSSTSSGTLVTFIRIRDRLSIFFAVLFWICLFFWASMFDDSNGGKPNKRPWFRNYLWAAAGKQADLEKQVGVGGYGYPALVVLNVKKGAYAPLRNAFELDQIIKFVKEAGRGGKGNLPLSSAPTVVLTEAWDSKDGLVLEEDEFSLEDLMGEEDTTPKDEL